MIPSGRAAVACATAALLTLPALAASSGPRYPEAPPPAHTGGFGEPTCHACHFDYDPQPANDALVIHGLPSKYVPGQTYRLTVILTRPSIRNAGFQLAVRFADGPERGNQAGDVEIADARSEITASGSPPVQFIHHTRTGTVLTSPDSASWTLVWTAPAATSPVSIDVSANAANDDASALGDYVYARAYSLTAR